MTESEEKKVLEAIKGKDISEVIALATSSGNIYSKRILKFFRWFCKWMPIVIMLFHVYGIYDFANNPHEMFIPNKENCICYAFIYFMLYILPMVIILASRFFFLCWRYRIPFFYFFGVNALHLGYWNWYTTNEMIIPHFCLCIMILSFYLYGFINDFLNTKLGRRLFG